MLQQHIPQAKYQSLTWRKSTDNVTDLDPPEQHGWIIDNDEKLDVKRMACNPVPDEVYF